MFSALFTRLELVVKLLRKLINGRLIKLCRCSMKVDGAAVVVVVDAELLILEIVDESTGEFGALMRGVVSDEVSELD